MNELHLFGKSQFFFSFFKRRDVDEGSVTCAEDCARRCALTGESRYCDVLSRSL